MPALVAFLISGLVAVFRSQIGRWVIFALAYLGLTYGAEHFAVQPMLDQIRNYVTGNATGTLLDALGIIRFDICVSMILSAYSIKYAVTAARVFLHKR